jgi:hypothetical protein
MSEIQSIFPDSRSAALAIEKYINCLRPSPNKYHLRAYDFHHPDTSEWWFIPGDEWPAYRFSKLFVNQINVAPSEEKDWLCSGLYIEKGYGGEAAKLYPVKHSQILQRNWYWFRFIEHARNDDLDISQRDILKRCGCPAYISLDAIPMEAHEEIDNREPEIDRKLPHDKLLIEVKLHNDQLSFSIIQPGSEILSGLKGVSSIKDLAEFLEVRSNDLDFFWIDLLFGVHIKRGDLPSGGWGAPEIWRNTMEPWQPWVG